MSQHLGNPGHARASVADGAWRRPAARSLLVAPLRNARELIPSLAPVILIAVSQRGMAYWLLLLVVILPVLLAVLRWWTTTRC